MKFAPGIDQAWPLCSTMDVENELHKVMYFEQAQIIWKWAIWPNKQSTHGPCKHLSYAQCKVTCSISEGALSLNSKEQLQKIGS